MSARWGGLQKASAFVPGHALRTGTVRGPPGAVPDAPLKICASRPCFKNFAPHAKLFTNGNSVCNPAFRPAEVAVYRPRTLAMIQNRVSAGGDAMGDGGGNVSLGQLHRARQRATQC